LPNSNLKDLVRNPLGIIAIFISLIYGVASLLLGMTATSLQPAERIPLIAFVTLFPLVVLKTFYLLVTLHHGKLYAPGDFKNDASFLRTLSPEEVEQRLRDEFNETLPPVNNEKAQSEDSAPAFGEGPTVGDQNPSKDVDYGNEMLPALRLLEERRFVESNVITKLEREFGQPANQNIEIAKAGVVFDAFIPGTSKPTFVEVKMLTIPQLNLSLLEKVLYNALLADRAMEGNFRLVFVVVYSFPKERLERIERYWRRKIDRCPAEVELRFIARDELDAKPGTER
jgi:hypothetical protein